MKYLGVDFGSKRVGVAVSNEEGTIAFPRKTLPNDENLLRTLLQIVGQEKIERIIIGDTRSHGGGENPITVKAEKFMETLAKETKLRVSPAFEVFSSIEASRYAPGHDQHNDAAAAAVILQRYLDMHGAEAA